MSHEISEAKKKFIADFMDVSYPIMNVAVSGCGMAFGVTLDAETDMLYAGTISPANLESSREFGVSIDYDFSLYQNLEELYEEIISKIMV